MATSATGRPSTTTAVITRRAFDTPHLKHGCVAYVLRHLSPMSRNRIPPGAPCDVARHRRHLEPLTRLWSGLANSLGLIIHGWVEDQFADDLAGGGVDDADVEAVDQHQDGGS